MAEIAFDPIKPWFLAAEDLGEYIGIRFGHIQPGTTTPDWTFLRHVDFDGIGGFADLLRQRGASIPRLPQIKHPAKSSWVPFFKTIPKMLKPRRRLNWLPMDGATGVSTAATPPSAVAWHAFDENATTQIRRVCRNGGFTVNSFLLKHLTKAIRPYLEDESATIPWMVPVNLRGKVTRALDTSNYSSYIGVRICSYQTVKDIHRNIYAALGRSEHWANWHSYSAGRLLGMGLKRNLVASGKAMPEWYLGGFSNLGDWDPDKKITQRGCEGTWVFSPPVLRCQLVGAGCVTFQNRLSVMIQVHPELTTNSAIPSAWVRNWIKEIEMDLSSVHASSFNYSLSSLAA